MDVENQTHETQTETHSTATRDDLIAAVREAGGTASVDVEAEEQAAQARAAAAATATAAPTTEQTATTQAQAAPDPLEAILKKREEAFAKRQSADEYITQLRSQADSEAKRIIEEARAEAKRVADQELASLRAKFAGSPTATIRALAEDGNVQSVVDAVVREGTPEARAIARAEEQARLAREEAKAGSQAKAELEKFKSDQERERRDAYVAQVREHFISTNASAEKAPYMHARWEPAEIFDRCDELCRAWQKDGLRLGIDFDQTLLVAYLEKQSKERITKSLPSSATPAQQVSAGAPAKEPGNAPKVSANGPRTLSAAQGSERRTSPRPISEMTAEEKRAALIEEVAAARRSNPDAIF